MKNIYIVTVANIHKKTDEEWKQEFEIEKIKYSRWEFYTLKDWKEYLEKNKEIFKCYNYKIEDEIVGYFTNMKNAHKALYENMFDVAECGTYPYAIIQALPTNTFYPEVTERPSPLIYRYGYEAKKEDSYDLCTNEDGSIKENLKGLIKENIKVLMEYYK